MADERFTLAGWNEYQKLNRSWYVVDPDGFDREAEDFNTRLYTREEFVERAMRSTVFMPHNKEN